MSAEAAPDLARDEQAVTWYSVHPATPIVQAIKALAVLLAVVVFQVFSDISEALQSGGTVFGMSIPTFFALAAILAIVVIGGIVGGYSYLAWRKMKFAIGREAVYFHRGILFRQQRHARLNRIQAVDVIRPLLARFFGLAAVDVQTAGGASSNVQISYLKEEHAERVRNEILARAAGLDAAPAPAEAAAGAAPQFTAAPERQVLTVGFGRLLGSVLLTSWLLVLILAGIVFLAIAAATGQFGALFGVVPGVLAVGGFVWGRLAGEFNFTLAISPDGIRSRHGLTETRAQTIPPRRIQAIGVTQPFLWRLLGWWRVEVNVAGYGAGSDGQTSGTSQTKNVLLPVGDRYDLERVLWLVVPDLGVPDPKGVIDALLTGSGPGAGFYVSPRRAQLLDWVSWRRHGLRVTATALLMRRGLFVRRAAIVPHERTQSLRLSQGPLERLLGLANFAADSVPGPVATTTYHLPAPTALAILREQAERARTARAAEGPEEWMRRVHAPGQ